MIRRAMLKGHVEDLRAINVTPHVAQNNGPAKIGKRRRSSIDARTTRHASYGMSQKRRKMIECIFGWGKRTAKPQISRFFRRLLEAKHFARTDRHIPAVTSLR